ncbi:hypothetical protein [Acetobacter pasteurianus]|uniref:hypothetical protein n=1 Tax=Acetobacter pasteurianus TaxID=438 RepID=UPI001362B280|nr:hypothetical protein [Acetobacter pasteurianus]QHM90319.1 hypothetical protein FCN51_01625 [Acetobacter pasteurianus]
MTDHPMRDAVIRIVKRSDDGHDHCCFCRTETNMLSASQDVPCCNDCSADHLEPQIPTRQQWLDEEMWLRFQSSEKDQPPLNPNYIFGTGKTYSEMIRAGETLPPYRNSLRWQTEQFYLEWLTGLKVGDHFFVLSGYNGENPEILKIEKVTKNQIVAKKKKWSRSTGLLIANPNPLYRMQEVTAQNIKLKNSSGSSRAT